MQSRGALYDYTYGKLSDRKTVARYGIIKQDLDASIDQYEFTCVIVRNSDLTNMLAESYEEKAHVIKIFVYSDENKIRERMEADNYSPGAIEYRSDRIKETWEDYVRNFNPTPNTHVLINNGIKTDYHQLINKLFAVYSDKNEDPNKLFIHPNAISPLIQPLVGFKKDLLKILKNHAYHKNVFVMMRFRDGNETIFKSIRDELGRHGFHCMRSDHPPFDNATKNFFQPIAALYCCKYGIALFDKPGENDQHLVYSPSVAYELGMMQNQDKNCLVLKHKSLEESYFFDIRKDLTKSYEDGTEIAEHVRAWIQNIQSNDFVIAE